VRLLDLALDYVTPVADCEWAMSCTRTTAQEVESCQFVLAQRADDLRGDALLPAVDLSDPDRVVRSLEVDPAMPKLGILRLPRRKTA